MAQDPQLFIDENVIGQELGVSLDLAGRSGTAPEQESQLRVASKRLGIPLDSARTDPQKTLQVAKDAEFNPTDYAKRFPNAARFLADQSNALIARDDVRPLSEVEQRVVSMVKEQQYGSALNPVAATIMRLMPERAAAEEEVRQTLRTQGFAAASAKRREIDERMSYGQPTGIAAPMEGPAPSVGSVAGGMLTSLTGGAKQARVSGQLAINDLFNTLGAQPNDVYTRDLMRKYQQETARIEASTPAFESSTGRGLYAGAQSLARQAPGLAVSVATGTTLPALAAAGANTAGEAYGRYRSRGATPGEAALGTGGETAVEILTERLPMKFVVDNLGKAGFGEFLRGFLGRELITEQVATIAQDAIDTAVANPNKTWAEYWAERPDAAYQTALATLVQSGAIGAVNTVLTNTVGRAEMQRREQERAFTGAAQLEQLLAAAAESQTRVRAPESFSQLVQQAAVSSGAVSEVYFDARPLVDVLEQSGMTPEQIEQLLPSVADTLGEAVVTNGTVAIPVGELTTAFAGSGVEQALLQHARTAPDAQSVADAEQSQELLAQLQQDAEQALAQQQERAAWEASSQEVFDNILGQLSTAGRFSQDVSKAQATVVRDFFTVMAARTGMTPSELYQRYPLRVTARNPVGGEQLAQSDLQRALAMSEDEYIAAVNPTNARDTEDEGVVLSLGDLDTPSNATQIAAFQDADGNDVQIMRDGNGAMYAVRDGETLGSIGAFEDGTGIQLVREAQGKGIGRRLTMEYLRENPFAPAGSFTAAGEANRRSAFRALQAEQGVLNQSVPQTDTEAFKRWFGDSKVVDADGKPLVVYHGRSGDFSEFDPERSGSKSKTGAPEGTFFFTDAPDVASSYTVEYQGDFSTKLVPDANVLPTYLSIKKPLKVSAKGESWRDIVYKGEFYDINELAKLAQDSGKYDGLIVTKVKDKGRGDVTSKTATTYVAFRPEQIKSAIGNRGTFDANDPNILNQGEAARATFSPSTLEIALLERADLSSFLHELGHFYFEVLADIASQPGAPQQIVDDMGALLQAAGFGGTAAEWLQQPLDTRRQAHEMVAESFEQYLFDGKAPSLEQQRLFNRLRAWMVSVYRTIAEFLQTNRNAQLSDEVRGVFDRMLATDAQIEAARAARQFGPMFESAEQAGMSPEEFAAYQEEQQAEIDDATRDLDARRLRDMRWLQSYRGKKLRELQKESRARRKAVQEEVTKEVDAMPVYETLAFIRSGRLPNGVEKPAGIESTRINRGAVESMYGEQFKVPDRLLSRNGLDPEAIVALLPGRFDSGDEMVRAVSNAEPRVQLIEAMTDQRMLERYGDLATPEDIERAADAAIANDAHTRMVATELGAVTKQLGSVQAIRRASREFAERQTGSRAIKYLRPDQAAADAARQRKAADVALRKGDTDAVVEAKRNELLSLELQRAQTKAKEDIVKARNDMQRLWGKDEQKAKTRDMNLVNAARAIVAQYGIAPERAGNTALAYIELVRQYDAELATNLQMLIDQAPEPKPFKDLTVDEFRALRDVVGSLWFMSKRTKQIEIDGQKLDMDEVAGELVERVVEINDGELPPLPGYTSTPTKFDHLKKGTLGMLAMGRRVESWADGMGPVFTRYIWNPVSESVTRYRGKRNEMVGKYRDLLKSIEPGLTYRPIDAPELGPEGFTFNAGKSEVLHALLHSGNSSNLRKLLVGRGWGAVDENTGALDTSRWDAFVNRMVAEGQITKADFDFVQGVWDLLESIKADAQRAHREIYGYYFNEVTAEPIQTPFGEYRGGYVPAVADPISSPDQAQKIEAEQANAVGNSYMFPTTGRGFTMARVEYNRPLMLDLRTLASHIDKVARFAFIEPAVRDVGKLLQNKRVARAINGHDQGAISSMLMPWLQRAAQQTVALPGKNKYSDKFFNSLRARSGMFLMFGNVVNTLQQVTGFSVAALKVPAPRLARATYNYLRNPAKMAADASELSPWLADRLSNQSFEMQQAIQDVLIDPNVYQKADAFMKRNAYFMQQAVQNVMDVIVWHGAYDRAIGLGLNERAAVREADNAVRTTQGSFAPEDVSAIEVQTPFVRLFTQFWGYFNMLANTMGTEAGKAMRDLGYMASTRRLAFIWFAGLAVPAFVAELIARGAPGDDEDEDGDGVLDEWLAMFFGSQVRTVTAMVPVAGQAAQLGFNQLDDKWYNDRLNISPSLSLAESAASAVGNLLQGDAFDERLTKKEVRDTATLIGLATGMPTNVVAKPVGYLLDVEAGKKQPEGAVDYAIGLTTGR